MKINKIKVIEAMEKIGIQTQTELAKRLGITKNQLSVILSENYEPVKAGVSELCKALEIDPGDILEAQSQPTTTEEDKNVESINQELHIQTQIAVTAIELFAGAGGLAVGLEQAGIHTKQFVEIDKFCCATLKTNRPDWNVINADITGIDFTQYRSKIDVVTGGFPCQAFSFAGKKLGFEDTRGTLFYEFARCINEVQPIIFMAENVRGLLTHDCGRTIQVIMNVFGELGYHVQHKVLNAAHYGVAQKRERIVIIGKKDGIHFEYPKKRNSLQTLKDALKDCPYSEGQKYSENKKKVLDLVPPGGSWIDLPIDLQKSYLGKSYFSGGGKRGMARRIAWHEQCLTLTCSPSQKQTERCHPEETRPFTVREYARIQSFPDDWQFKGGIGSKYKQIGNAVPVELARQLGVQLKTAVDEFRKSGHINN